MRRPVPKTLAVVDLGSNAVRLQVASAQPDGTLEVRAEDRAAVRLGAQVFRTGRLSSESISGCAGALVRFAKLAQTAGATHVRAVATSAVREASNRDELLRAARSRAGIDIEVISGAEEARLVCLGVFQGTSASDRSLLIDIGGGSTEIISAHGEEPEHAFSLQLGSVRLSEFFVEHDPISRREAQLIEEAVEDAVLQIDPVLIGKHRRIIGAAGTTGAVAALAQSMSGTPGGSRPVSHAEVRAVLDKLRSADLKKRKKLGVDPSRIDVIYAGTAILEGVMRKLRVEEMQVTTRGLRDGLMADLVRREVRPPAAGLHEENAVLEGLRAFGRRCGYREPHAEQVAQLSLALFDQLRPMHRLGAEERGLLHAAAQLHDVGTFVLLPALLRRPTRLHRSRARAHCHHCALPPALGTEGSARGVPAPHAGGAGRGSRARRHLAGRGRPRSGSPPPGPSARGVAQGAGDAHRRVGRKRRRSRSLVRAAEVGFARRGLRRTGTVPPARRPLTPLTRPRAVSRFRRNAICRLCYRL
ncbi:MAG: Ppx/GppA family phosphatase [Deltaproteobacteria bacterium]|nr:MAG: Ppx/GppA family phosphatase [Deltaproteobacteria bacterium]